jgi:hypothetical protein
VNRAQAVRYELGAQLLKTEVMERRSQRMEIAPSGRETLATKPGIPGDANLRIFFACKTENLFGKLIPFRWLLTVK